MAGRSGIGDAEKAWRGVLVGSLWTPGYPPNTLCVCARDLRRGSILRGGCCDTYIVLGGSSLLEMHVSHNEGSLRAVRSLPVLSP